MADDETVYDGEWTPISTVGMSLRFAAWPDTNTTPPRPTIGQLWPR